MSVTLILAKKGREVVTIGAERLSAASAALEVAADILNLKRIGAAVVVDEAGRLLGIVSERDVLRAVAERGGAALDGTVADHMTRDVTTCAPSTSIDEVMSLMTEGKFRHLPVIEDGRLGGIVSIGDVVKHRLADVEAEHQALREYIATA